MRFGIELLVILRRMEMLWTMFSISENRLDGSDMKITDIEYQKLINRLEFHDLMRNNLLTFSFTAVLTVLGIALKLELNAISACVCLLPYLLIVPFAARISYYRLASAHISSFLGCYAKDRVQFELNAERVQESNGIKRGYSQLAFLVNHEMFLLGITSSLVFYLKFIPCTNGQLWWNYVGYITPIALAMWVFCISHSTNKYDDIVKRYQEHWATIDGIKISKVIHSKIYH